MLLVRVKRKIIVTAIELAVLKLSLLKVKSLAVLLVQLVVLRKGENTILLTEQYVAPNYDTYYNYIEVYDDKGRVCRIGDPYILKYNGEYYLYTSCTGHLSRVGIPCWKSTNMVWAYRD